MTKYFKSIILIAVFCSGTIWVFAQDSHDRNKIKALKVAFITERLSLSSSEAETFWPIYNSFEEKRDALRHRQHREVYDEISKTETLTESQAKTLLKKYLSIEEEEEELDKEFYTKLSNEISARKTLLLFSAEHDFRKQLIKQMRNKRKEN
jgi:hypothetical protein